MIYTVSSSTQVSIVISQRAKYKLWPEVSGCSLSWWWSMLFLFFRIQNRLFCARAS